MAVLNEKIHEREIVIVSIDITKNNYFIYCKHSYLALCILTRL